MTSRRSIVRRAAVTVAAVTAAVTLAAGSSNATAADNTNSVSAAPAASASRSTHNAQDVAFLQDMIPHHRQAVAMAGLAPGRAKSQDVKNLAAKIEKDQAPQIAAMSGGLKSWHKSVPTGDMPSMKGMGGSGNDMSGMMSQSDMAQLEKLSGTAFDTAFLKMMIQHHQSAVQMAKTEQSKGSYGPAKKLAASIITSQSAQITQMKKMLGN